MSRSVSITFVNSFLAVLLVAGSVVAQPVPRTVAVEPDSRSGPLEHPVPGAEGEIVSIRMEPGQGDRDDDGWITTVAPQFVNIPKMSASFVAADHDTNVVVTFSAEARTTVAGKRLVVRALIDGQVANPSNVIFTEGPFSGARSFEFTTVAGPGIHTVEIQWMVDSGARAYLRAGSLKIRQGRKESEAGTLVFKTPPSGPNVVTDVAGWKSIPGMSLQFYVTPDARPIISFSAETLVQGVDKNLWVRAVVDGLPAMPGDVVLARRNSRHVHLAEFTTNTLTPGWHTVRMEWQVSAGGIAQIGDRTLAVSARPTAGDVTHRLVVAPSGPAVEKNTPVWEDVPNLTTFTFVPENGEIAVTFAGEVSVAGQTELYLRLRVGNSASDEEAIVIGDDTQPFEMNSFAFDRKHVITRATGSGFYDIGLEWRVNTGQAFMGDRVMEVVIEPGPFPDLAEAPEFGRGAGAFPGGMPVEAAIGTRPLLAIIHRIDRDAPNDVIPTVAEVEDALFGAHGLSEYFLAMSNGLFTFTNAGVLEYDAEESEDHYWNHPACGAPGADEYTGGHQERWAEAILSAEHDLDFASYDRDNDGILQPNELAILIITPQDTVDGFRRDLQPYCSGDPFVVDDVVVPAICEWFTSNPQLDLSTPVHEICHLVLELGDMYVNGVAVDTEPNAMSLMGNNAFTTTHLDAMNKLALGWVTPVEVESTGAVVLETVRTSHTVAVMPRRTGGDGREYYLLENRVSAAFGDPTFDEQTFADGIALWHVVEDQTMAASLPLCMDAAVWAGVTGNIRRSVRLVRPRITAGSDSLACWNDERYDIDDSTIVCPGPGVDPTDRRTALVWADGTPSGYSITNWGATADVMSFFVTVP